MSYGPLSVAQLIERGDKQFTRFQPWHSYCQAVAEIFYPERADFIAGNVEGAERYKNIFSGEAILLRERLASGLGALVRRPSKDWFLAKVMPSPIGEIESVKRWAEAITEVQRDALYARAANFQRAMKESDADYVAFGASVLSHTDNKNRTGLFYRCLHLRDCAWFENEHGEIDEMHEKIEDKSLDHWRALMARAGGTLPREWEEKLRCDPGCGSEIVKVRRVVLPVDRYKENGRIKGRAAMPYAVVYFAPGEKHEMFCSGFRVFPYLVRRWATVSGEPWGRSPCTGVAMADARVLNTAQRSILESLEKAVDPPTLVPHDGIIGDIEIFAGGVIKYDAERGKARDVIDTLAVGDVKIGMEFSRERIAFLTQAFYGDILRRLPDKQMTAYEVAQWLDEYITEAAPVFAPMEAENALLMESGLIRLMDMSGRPGAPQLPPPPQEAQGREISYEFETPVSIAYRKQKAQQADDVLGFVERVAALSPDALDNVDIDQITRDTVEGRGSMKWLKPQDEVEAARQQRAMIEMAKTAAAAAALDAQQQQGGKPARGVEQAAEALGVPTQNTAGLDLAGAA